MFSLLLERSDSCGGCVVRRLGLRAGRRTRPRCPVQPRRGRREVIPRGGRAMGDGRKGMRGTEQKNGSTYPVPKNGRLSRSRGRTGDG